MATAKQIAARKLFAQRAKAGTLRRGTRSKKQNLAIAMSEQRAGHPRKAKEFFEAAARSKNPTKSKKPSKKAIDIEKALKALNFRIRHGEEFPDASFRVSQEHFVDYESLADAYDAQDRRKNPSRGGNDAIHIDIDSHNTGGRNVRAKNPRKSMTAQKVVIDKNPEFVYLVQKWHTLAGEWINLAGFDHFEDAEHFAKLKIKTSATQIRVVDQYA